MKKKKELFTGAQILDTDDDWIVMGAPSVTGTPTFTGAHEYGEVTGAPQENIPPFTSVTGAHSFTGTPSSVTGNNVTGARQENIPVTGAPFTGAN